MDNKRIPVILDTDIGDDIDDTWALVLMLKSPELDVKLVATETGNTTYRAKIVAKLLQVAERTTIPIAVGLHQKDETGPQEPWVAGYDLAAYPGRLHADGVGAIIQLCMESPEPVTLVCIGPLPNIAAALEREPRIAERTRFVGMHGSVRLGYEGSPKVAAEYNVASDPKSCQKVFTAPWDMTITPLDTCGIVRLRGEKYRKVRTCPDPTVQALMENYRVWLRNKNREAEFDVRSSVLYDTVAVYLAFTDELLVMEKLGIRVTDDGFTVEDAKAKAINCALAWKDLPTYEDFLVARLTGSKE